MLCIILTYLASLSTDRASSKINLEIFDSTFLTSSFGKWFSHRMWLSPGKDHPPSHFLSNNQDVKTKIYFKNLLFVLTIPGHDSSFFSLTYKPICYTF